MLCSFSTCERMGLFLWAQGNGHCNEAGAQHHCSLASLLLSRCHDQTITAETMMVTNLRLSWPVSRCMLDKLHIGRMLRSIKVLMTPLRLHEKSKTGSFQGRPACGNAPIQGNKIMYPLRHTLHSIQAFILKHSDCRLLCYTAKNT